MLLSHIDALTNHIDTPSVRIEELIAELPDDRAIDHPQSDPGAGAGADQRCRSRSRCQHRRSSPQLPAHEGQCRPASREVAPIRFGGT